MAFHYETTNNFKNALLLNFLREGKEKICLSKSFHFNAFVYRFFTFHFYLTFFEDHFKRMKKILDLFNFKHPENFELEKFINTVKWFSRKKNYYKSFIVELFFKREGDQTISLLDLHERNEKEFIVSQGVIVDFFENYKKNPSPWANLIQDSWLKLYTSQNIKGKIFDFFIQDGYGNIIETVNYNFFIITKAGKIFFPDSNIYVDRVSYRFVKKILKRQFNAEEKKITLEDLKEDTEEIYLVNDENILVPVIGFKDARYLSFFGKKLIKHINELTVETYLNEAEKITK